MMGLLNVASFVFGLTAWILPAMNLMRYRSNGNKNWITLSMLSLSACAISLCLQMFYTYHLVRIEDWTALMNTAGAVVFAATVLLVVTILLNTITLFVFRDKTAK